MSTRILALRFTRRAIGVASIDGEELSVLDGRFLNPRPERTIPSAQRYIAKLLDITVPTTVVIDAPGGDGSTTAGQIRQAAEELLKERRIPVLVLDRGDILSAFGVRRVEDRRTLRELMEILWPGLADVRTKVKPYVADAAAAALYGESCAELGVTLP